MRIDTARGRRLLSLSFAAALVVLAAGCEEGSTGPRVPARLEVVSGSEQNAVVGTEVPLALTVRLVDAAGRPVPNHPISFYALVGGGSLTPSATQTGADGTASARWRLGTTSGIVQQAAASVTGTPEILATFVASATPGAATQVELEALSLGFGSPGQVIDSFTAVVLMYQLAFA